MAAPTGGAGLAVAATDVIPVIETTGPLAGGVVVKGALRLVPYVVVEEGVKAGRAIGKGATGAKLITVRGQQMVYKSGRPGIVANEYIAYQLYAVLGARVPASYLVVNADAGGIPMAVMTEYLPGALTIAEATDMYKERDMIGKITLMRLAVQSDFLFHALLLNWDAKNWENFMVVPLPAAGAAAVADEFNFNIDSATDTVEYDVDHPYTVDPGGALFYRAMGTPKTLRDLTPFEIKEFTTMPEFSRQTYGKFFRDLFDEGQLYSTVCRKAALVDDAAVMRVVSEMEPLFGYLPLGADLPGLISGRLAYMRSYCAGEVAPVVIDRAAPLVKYHLAQKTDLESVYGAKTAGILKARYETTLKSLREEALGGLRVRGLREMRVPPPLVAEDFERFRVNPFRPIPLERRHAGVNSYGWEYNSNSNSSSNSSSNSNSSSSNSSEGDSDDGVEKPGLYPYPPYTVRLDRSVDAERVRHTVAAYREDAAIDAWLRKQVRFIRKDLSLRERRILQSYTRNGDMLVNSYLRGTLRVDDIEKLLRASLKENPSDPGRPIALAYSVLDQFSTIARDREIVLLEGLEKAEYFLDYDGELNLGYMRKFMMANLHYFRRMEKLGPLLEQYRRDLVAILTRAPRAPHAFTVFRGIKSEAHASSLQFRNVDFLSTSMSPEWTARVFTQEIKDPGDAVTRTYRCCMYELEVRPDIPCIYMQSLSDFEDEYEILIAPGMSVSLEPTVWLKMVLPENVGGLTKTELRGLLGPMSSKHVKIAVVEGSVRQPAMGGAATAAAAVEEEGSLEGIVAKHGRRLRWSEKPELFAAQKPRGQVKERNRTRRFSTAWKATANRNKRRATRKNSGNF